MLDGPVSALLSEQLLEIAGNPSVRHSVYDRLGDYCHQCRNRLNSLKLSLYLAIRQSSGPQQEAWKEIERDYLVLERLVERLQTICRPMTLSRVTIPLDLLIQDRMGEWARLMAAGGCELECVTPRVEAVASFDVERMGQALDAVVRWRAGDRDPSRSARLRWWVEAGTAHVVWDEARSKPSRDVPGRSGQDACWALPLVSRVVSAHAGEFKVTEDRGWRLDLSWPAATLTT